jgi:hypothetical protein
MDVIADIGRWLADLDPTFAFLLALPFAVAAAGVLAGWLETRRQHRRRHAIASGAPRPTARTRAEGST